MDWVKLPTNYYLDPAIIAAGDEAEMLFVRAFAYAGDHETDGMIPAAAIIRLTPHNPAERVAALLREGLWVEVENGYRIARWWDDLQETAASLEGKRAAERDRQRAYRERKKQASAAAPGDGPRAAGASRRTSRVTNAAVTPPEVEVEVETAAAAAVPAAAAASSTAEPTNVAGGLPVAVDILRTRLQGHTQLAALRFDQLTRTQLADLEQLVDTHGDARLVDVAVRTCRPTPPVSVAAFLGTWRSLPPPGQRLAVVAARCDVHDWVALDQAGTCRSCAADRLAGGDR
ncbi:hypothetical protein [Nocardioides alkalitolerans]|uniref:hypothetical protein n=1 Tax=Nocardioides alkalitolerans TaxID=281714 RepID=UPI000411F97E|nr:hypothetical protein [Nocardioides alkalitolerans]